MNSAKDYTDCTHKRPFADARLHSSSMTRDLKPVVSKETCLSNLSAMLSQPHFYEDTAPTKKKPRLQSLADIPNEILLCIQSNLTHPPDLLRFSQTCTLFRKLTDDGAWCKAYKNLVSHWAQGTEVGHLQEHTNMWRQVVMDDHLRKTLHWVPNTNDVAAKNPEQVRLRISLEQATHIKPLHMQPSVSETSRWRNVGPPASHTDSVTRATLCAYMQTRTYGQHTDHQVALYGLPDHKRPLAYIPSHFWAHPGVDNNLDPDFTPDNLGVAQLMDVKQFPDQRDDQRRMRVVLILAFGERNIAPLGSEDGDVQFLDTWLLIKVVEVFICDTLHTTPGDDIEMEQWPRLVPYRPDPFRGHVETIVPSTRHELIRGRAVRLYSSRDPLTGARQDRIALFGIFLGARIQAIVMTSPLFVSSLPESMQNISLNCNVRPASNWKYHLLGGNQCLEASCLALFPPQSDFENLLVVLDRKGRGEIWDWMEVIKVAELKMAMDDSKPDPGPQHEAPDERNTEVPQEPEEETDHRRDLHYWGVQVNWTVEEPMNNDRELIKSSPQKSGHRQHGDFRIVALADGQNKEWEVCWWHVSEQELRRQLRKGPSLDGGSQACWEIQSSSRHFENSTEFKTWPSSKPQEESELGGGSGENHLLFIAYLIWDHYRIALTSQYGLCLFDMDQELPGDILGTEASSGDEQGPRLPQWMTMIEDANDDPLIDIATVGDCLFLTRKYSHMIWPFRGILGKQALP